MRCNNCGYVNSNDEKNCKNCGNILIKDTNIRNYKNQLKDENQKTGDGILNNITSGKIIGICALILIIIFVVGSATPDHEDSNIIDNIPVENVDEPTIIDEPAENSTPTTQINSTITVKADNTKAGKSTIIQGYLKDTENNPLGQYDIIIQVDNNKYITQSGNDGKYQLTYNNTTKGTHQVTATFQGNENTTKSENTTQFTAKEKTANIEVNIKNPMIKDTKNNITGSLRDDENNPIGNAPLKIRINNNQLTTQTTTNGSYNIEYTPTDTSNKEVTVTYEGNDTIDKTSTETHIEIIEENKTENNSTPYNNNTNKNNTQDNHQITKDNSTYNNTTSNDNHTDNNTTSDNNDTKDNYSQFSQENKTSHTNNSTTQNDTNTENYTDNTDKDKTKIDVDVDKTDEDNTTITGKLVDDDNKPIADAMIKIKIDNNEYTATTDSTGEYTLDFSKLTSGSHEITVIYEGDNDYKDCNDTTRIII